MLYIQWGSQPPLLPPLHISIDPVFAVMAWILPALVIWKGTIWSHCQQVPFEACHLCANCEWGLKWIQECKVVELRFRPLLAVRLICANIRGRCLFYGIEIQDD